MNMRAYSALGDHHYFVRRTVMSDNDNVSLNDLTDEDEISRMPPDSDEDEILSMPAYSEEDQSSNESLHRMSHVLMDRRLGVNALMNTDGDLIKIRDKVERLERTLKTVEDKLRPLHATKYTIEIMHHDLNLQKYMEMPEEELMYVILSSLTLQDLDMMMIKCGYPSSFFSTLVRGSMDKIFAMYCKASDFEREYERKPTSFCDFPAELTSNDMELDTGLFVTRVGLENGYMIRDILQNVKDRAMLTVDKFMFSTAKKHEYRSANWRSEYCRYWRKIMSEETEGEEGLVLRNE